MSTGQKIARFFIWLAIAFVQFVSTQIVTLLASFAFPDMENFPQTQPLLFVFVLGITFSIGVFLVGWLALKLRWLKMEPKLIARLIGTLVGAYLPLVIALFLYHPMEPGNPFFFIAMLTSVAGFYLGGWIGKK
ncbi:MAG: hypothetical protein FD146_1927 [Anaerolineaceae bacterium]|nr:MAG: hypothetical protein FD146_1927 [Anaerolineaceae bacterium]